MPLPATNYSPPFNITRASHIVLTVQDLNASKDFYVNVAGLIVSEEDPNNVYLRGVEEACHHSLVLRKSDGRQSGCEWIGLRVFTEEVLDKAKFYFDSIGVASDWSDVSWQGRTLHFVDPLGVRVELCATMPIMPRMHTEVAQHRGAAALRLDHFQLHVDDVQRACDFYMPLGFRASDYWANSEEADVIGVFLQRKGNPHDIVFLKNQGPRVHHFAFAVPDQGNILRACDVAGNLGFGRNIERGPGRHGMGHVMFVYIRDPDGHRLELHDMPYQMIDIENLPTRWDVGSDPFIQIPWGLPGQAKWHSEATEFANTSLRKPNSSGTPFTLESYLAVKLG